jgi:hypothetical protein
MMRLNVVIERLARPLPRSVSLLHFNLGYLVLD